MTPRLYIVSLSVAAATTALAQDGAAPAPASSSLTPLLIMTSIVLALVVLALWLAPRLTSRPRTPQAPHPDQPPDKLTPRQQAVGAVAAFEKARLMGKKVAHAAPKDVARGGEAGDEHPS